MPMHLTDWYKLLLHTVSVRYVSLMPYQLQHDPSHSGDTYMVKIKTKQKAV